MLEVTSDDIVVVAVDGANVLILIGGYVVEKRVGEGIKVVTLAVVVGSEVVVVGDISVWVVGVVEKVLSITFEDVVTVGNLEVVVGNEVNIVVVVLVVGKGVVVVGECVVMLVVVGGNDVVVVRRECVVVG